MGRRGLVKAVAVLAALGGLLIAAAGAGYFAHKQRIWPVYSVTERAHAAVRRLIGMPSDTEVSVARIETIFLTLNGRVHVMPDRDFEGGGAMTVWGDDLIVMHKAGRVFWLDRDEEEGLVPAPLVLPDNGVADYTRLAAEKYPGRLSRVGTIRYNDIDYVDAPGHRGLVLSYTFVDVAAECYRTRLGWLPLPAEVATIRDAAVTASDWEVLYDSNPCLPFNPANDPSLLMAQMAGGRVAFKAPDLLYLGNGDYHLDGIYRPDVGIQSDDNDYGKTIEISLTTRTTRQFSKGHRNLQGVTVDRDGQVWTTEHGMRGGDELNRVTEGGNYGWPVENLGTLYSGEPAPSPSGPGRHTAFTPPVFAWVPSVATSNVMQLQGFHETWDGDLLVGSLKARTIFRIRVQDGKVIYAEPIPIGQRVRDIKQWGPDRIALWFDTNEVAVLEVEPQVDPLDGLAAALVTGGMEAGMADRVAETMGACNECHSYKPDIHGAGPSLAGVVGRAVAGAPFENYSDALRGAGGSWTPERLAAYIASPETVVPGTAMTGMGVGDASLAAALATALARFEGEEPDL